MKKTIHFFWWVKEPNHEFEGLGFYLKLFFLLGFLGISHSDSTCQSVKATVLKESWLLLFCVCYMLARPPRIFKSFQFNPFSLEKVWGQKNRTSTSSLCQAGYNYYGLQAYKISLTISQYVKWEIVIDEKIKKIIISDYSNNSPLKNYHFIIYEILCACSIPHFHLLFDANVHRAIGVHNFLHKHD